MTVHLYLPKKGVTDDCHMTLWVASVHTVNAAVSQYSEVVAEVLDEADKSAALCKVAVVAAFHVMAVSVLLSKVAVVAIQYTVTRTVAAAGEKDCVG